VPGPPGGCSSAGTAYKNAFEDLAKRGGAGSSGKTRWPRYKKKAHRESFRIDNGTEKGRPSAVILAGKRAKLPRFGWVGMREEVRFLGNVTSAVISREADAWYCSFTVDVGEVLGESTAPGIVGVDLGITRLATLSDGTAIAPPAPLRRLLRKLRRLNRALHRKVRGSRNRAKARTKLARLHARIGHARADALHKLTTSLVQRFGTVVIENLNVRGMLANRCLSRAVSDVGFFELRRQLTYKAKLAGATIIVADRWFPSSKLCSACGFRNPSLALHERNLTCPSCGIEHDRDINAACNLARYPESWAGSACGADGSGISPRTGAKPAA